jgi:RNase H-like domain found in reverse transcriptase
MVKWTPPQNVKQLRGFLGLTGYYRKFIKIYGLISKPLSDLLKKNSFHWSSIAQQAFEELKLAMSQALVLALPDFSKPFIIETDASHMGIGAVLMQDRHPIAFMSHKLGVKNLGLSTYEKDFLALITAVTKWRHYLTGSNFIIRTDQISLKNLLDQKVNTTMQHRGLSKLLSLNYTIEYKRGIENKVVDALSRREGHSGQLDCLHGSLLAVSELIPQWVQDIQQSYQNDPWIDGLKNNISTAAAAHPHLSHHQGLVRKKRKICVGRTGN